MLNKSGNLRIPLVEKSDKKVKGRKSGAKKVFPFERFFRLPPNGR